MAGETGFLLDLGILTVSALVLSLIFAKFKLPIVSAQILAGMTVGPYVLGWIVDQTLIGEIASVGIVLLLFIIGLELDQPNPWIQFSPWSRSIPSSLSGSFCI